MRRREFIALAGAAAAFPRVGLAQQTAKLPRVAFGDGGEQVANLVATSTTPAVAAFFDEMTKLGFVEGRTILLERYYAPSANAQETARRIVASNPDMIFLRGAATTALAAMALTETISILVTSADPLGQGVVNNLAHPGRNVTAVASTASSKSEGKNFALLAEALPHAKRFAYIGVGALHETS